MLGTKVHSRGDAQREMIRQAQLAQYTNGEACCPSVGITQEVLLLHVAILIGHLERTGLIEFKVLKMQSNQNAKVHGAQVNVWLVLHLTVLLGNSQQAAKGEEYSDKMSFHTYN